MWLQKEVADVDYADDGTITPILEDGDAIKREKEGRKYVIVTREYMAQGHDGFLSLKDGKYLIDDEVGQMYSTLIRKYLLVSDDKIFHDVLDRIIHLAS
jgi:5'-nucleotidase